MGRDDDTGDSTFEEALLTVKEVHLKELTAKSNMISHLNKALAARDVDCQHLRRRIDDLLVQLHQRDESIQKLARFKETILSSIQENGGGAGGMSQVSPSRVEGRVGYEGNHSQSGTKRPSPIVQAAPLSSHDRDNSLKGGYPYGLRAEGFAGDMTASDLTSTARESIAKEPRPPTSYTSAGSPDRRISCVDARDGNGVKKKAYFSDISSSPSRMDSGNSRNHVRTGSASSSTNPANMPTTPSRTSASVSGASSIDGREFFKGARSRLPYDDFNQVLNIVRLYNERARTRDETLQVMSEILADQYPDLWRQFERLLQRDGK